MNSHSREVNPNFAYRLDVTSRRFRASEIAVFRIDATASLNFYGGALAPSDRARATGYRIDAAG